MKITKLFPARLTVVTATVVAMATAIALTLTISPVAAQSNPPDVPASVNASSDTSSAKPISPASPANRADQAVMEGQLRHLVDAYEGNDLKGFQGKLDPALPGFSRVMDAVRTDVAAQTRRRILFTDTTWVIGPNVSMFQASFEKRYFDARDLKPQLVTGQVVMLFTRAGEGWRLSTITGENPFVSRAAAACSAGQIRVVSTGGGDLAPVVIEVTDSDLSGVSEIQIEVGTNRSDREIVRLRAVNPAGLFRGQIGVRRISTQSLVTAGNGTIELSGDATIVARYNDPCATALRSALVVSASDVRRDPGVLGTLACRLPTALNFYALAANTGTQITPLIIELNDADLANQSTVDVVLRASGGDSENITLTSIGTGRFMGTSVALRAGATLAPVPRNGVIEISGATRLTVDYADQKSGIVGQTATVNAACGEIALGTPPVVTPPVLPPPVGVAPTGQLARLSCTMNFDNSAFTTPAFTANIPVTFELTDPDLVNNGPAFVEAVLRNNSGDAEIYRLPAVGAGRYALATVPVRASSAISGNGVLEFSGYGPITAEYRDLLTPSGGAQMVMQSCGNFTAGVKPATLATVSLAPSGIAFRSPSAIVDIGVGAPINAPCNLTVRDPDLANAPSVPVRVVTTQLSSGKVDTENFVLPAVSPGVFQLASCRYQGFTITGSVMTSNGPISGNGAIDLGGGTSTITVSYTDTTIPGGGSQVISATATVTN